MTSKTGNRRQTAKLNRVHLRNMALAAMLAVLLQPSLLLAAQAQKISNQDWYKASTAHFTIISDGSRKSVSRIADKLEKFRVLYALLFKVPFDSVRPVTLVTTRRDSSYKLFFGSASGASKTGGFFTNTITGNYSALRSYRSSREASLSILFHEYTHYLQANFDHHTNPYWYKEGFADFLSSTQFNRSGSIEYGVPLQNRLSELHNTKWMPMQRLLNLSSVSPLIQRDFKRVYSQGWLAVHYFTSNGERNLRLSNYLRLLHEGASVDEAVRDGLNTSYAGLDAELKKYKNSKKLFHLYISSDIKLPVNEATVEKMKPFQVAYEIGDFLLNARNDPDGARPFFEHAVSLKPQYAIAHAGLANTYLKDKLEAMEAPITVALGIDANNSLVATVAGHYYSALYRQAQTNLDKAKHWNAAVKHYNIAIANNSLNADALFKAAQLYTHNRRWDSALSLNEMALSIAVDNFSVKKALVRNYLAVGKTEKADALIAQLRRRPHMSMQGLSKLNEYIERVRDEFNGEERSPKDLR